MPHCARSLPISCSGGLALLEAHGRSLAAWLPTFPVLAISPLSFLRLQPDLDPAHLGLAAAGAVCPLPLSSLATQSPAGGRVERDGGYQ
jgi:hypothetical protein